MKKVTILGSTGSIGRNALGIISQFPREFKVEALSVDSNIDLLFEQIKAFKPKCVAVRDEKKAHQLKKRISSKFKHLKILNGRDGVEELAGLRDSDTVIVAISGTDGLLPTIKAITKGKQVALANKESLVTAGKIIIDLARRKNVDIIPIDSEHSAIFQCLDGKESRNHLSKIYLTGSGGRLRQVRKTDFDKLSRRDMLRHPKWKMGKKITIDSATLMNKGLEVIEAHWLFGMPPDKIEVLIHPEAIIHSMVEFVDGAVLAQLAFTDMRIPILYALTFPKRYKTSLPKLEFFKLKQLSFHKPDLGRFPCLDMAYSAIKSGGLDPCVLNAANEVAVKAYLKGKIKFTRIPKTIEKVLETHRNITSPTLDDVLSCDQWAKEKARSLCYR